MTGEDPDVALINEGLEQLQDAIGRALTPDEIQGLGELAYANRDADGQPDLSVMGQSLMMSELADVAVAAGVPHEDQQAFIELAMATDDGTPDVQGALDAMQEIYTTPVEPFPPLDPAATRAETQDWIADRVKEIERTQREDRQRRVQARQERAEAGEDPGPPDPDMRSWEQNAWFGPDTDEMSRSELAEYMADQVRERNAQDDEAQGQQEPDGAVPYTPAQDGTRGEHAASMADEVRRRDAPEAA